MLVEVWGIDGLADEVIDVLTGVMIEVGVDMLADEVIMVVAPAVIDLEFAVGVAYDVDVPTGFWDAVTIGVLTGIAVDVCSDMNVNGLTTVMTALDFALPAP